MAPEQRRQLPPPLEQVAPRRPVTQLAHRAPRREAEDRGEEHPVLVALGLEQDCVGIGESRGVAREPDLQPRVHQRAEHLVEHGGEAALDQNAAPHRPGLDGRPDVHGHDGIDAQQQLRPVLQRDRGVQRLEEHAVHAVASVNQHRRIDAGDGRTRLHGPGDGDVLPLRLAEPDGTARAEVGAHDDELVRQLAEVVRAPRHREDLREVAADRLVVEHAHGQRLGEAREGFAEGLVAGTCQQVPHRSGRQPGHLQRPPRQLQVGWREERPRDKRVLPRLVLDDRPHELGGRQPIGETGSDERPGADPDIDIEVVEVDAVQRLLEGPEGADLVHRALRPAARQRETEPPASRPAPPRHQLPVR